MNKLFEHCVIMLVFWFCSACFLFLFLCFLHLAASLTTWLQSRREMTILLSPSKHLNLDYYKHFSLLLDIFPSNPDFHFFILFKTKWICNILNQHNFYFYFYLGLHGCLNLPVRTFTSFWWYLCNRVSQYSTRIVKVWSFFTNAGGKKLISIYSAF